MSLQAPTERPARTSERLPLLPLKDVVIFPHMVVPLLIGRPASVAAVDESLASGRRVFVCTQRNPEQDEPRREDLYAVGVTASILQTLRMPDGTMKIVIEGVTRSRLHAYFESADHAEARVKETGTTNPKDKRGQALLRVVAEQFDEYVKLSQRVAPEVAMSLRAVEDADMFADLVCAHLSIKVDERQTLLESTDARERLDKINEILVRENELLRLEQEVRDQVRNQMERGQRDYYLQEQIKALQQELGQRSGEPVDEYSELRQLIADAKMPKEVHEKSLRELNRYERMPPLSPESAVIRTYLEWLTDLPWSKRTKDSIDLERAQVVLDEDHYGLEKVKDRILEFLAVRKLSKSTKGPVLCLVGPPGVGKTSLGKSIARAMGRKFVRVSLGGVRDEAEIRGHRRTYIGALPGRVIQSIKKCGVKNPLFMLDEIDKMNTDFRGDPASALLEVLDPEQNSAFSDHYLEVDFDLHQVFFVTTANSEYDIPEPLLDRMEIVRLSGYSTHEKERIARLFLIPKQLEENGVTEAHIVINDKALDLVIGRYTQEAGVRELERQIGALCRKVARKVVSSKEPLAQLVIDEAFVLELLGPPPYSDVEARLEPEYGLAIGLAWTVAGGDILNIETSIMKGKGGLQMTGQLGDVMQESAQAAYTYLRAHAKELRIANQFWKNSDIHLHVPEGAIPKDGPSAGVSMAVSMLSALRRKPQKPRLAMTGEITLQGRVLPVGGIKEKVLAAHRAGVRTIILPRENEKDLRDVPKEVSQAMTFAFAETMHDVFRDAFPPVVLRKPSSRSPRPASNGKRRPASTKRARKTTPAA